MFPTSNTKVEDPVRSRFWPTRGITENLCQNIPKISSQAIVVSRGGIGRKLYSPLPLIN